jgi:putative transposase
MLLWCKRFACTKILRASAYMMQNAGLNNRNNNDFQFSQQHNQPIMLDNNELIDQKVNCIHNNPVEASFVAKPEDWLYSSAIVFTLKGKGLLELAIF